MPNRSMTFMSLLALLACQGQITAVAAKEAAGAGVTTPTAPAAWVPAAEL